MNNATKIGLLALLPILESACGPTNEDCLRATYPDCSYIVRPYTEGGCLPCKHNDVNDLRKDCASKALKAVLVKKEDPKKGFIKVWECGTDDTEKK
ncbi:hypothetical protein HZA39_04290 [Candidatus Peregrinibacteria bacterium]|nr:hypothetical protein [Candidatus Peregrinibacteria bacterium]